MGTLETVDRGDPDLGTPLRVPLETPTALWLTSQVALFLGRLGTPIGVTFEEGSISAGSILVSGTRQGVARFEEVLHDVAGVYREIAKHKGASELSIRVALKSAFALHETRILQGLES
jgi:hypothetical protein